MSIQKTNIIIKPDIRRVLIRPIHPARETNTQQIFERIFSLTQSEVTDELQRIIYEFGRRHRNLEQYFMKRFARNQHRLPGDQKLSEKRKLLIGAYFSMEYSLEAAALFNPSIVWHPDQSGLSAGAKRFILSLRATGEGHISSIVFRSGIIYPELRIQMDEPVRLTEAPEIISNQLFDKYLFQQKLAASNLAGYFSGQVMAALPDPFTLDELTENIRKTLSQLKDYRLDENAAAILTLAESNYEVNFGGDVDLSEKVIFPTSPTESNGLEDARFVRFTDDDGAGAYYATYTAFDGHAITSQLLETADFDHFKIHTLHGAEVRDKGMALFPRKINGRYAMLSRQDSMNNYIMFSDNIHIWDSKQLLLEPSYPWEFSKIGNCGSPLETDAGWLVISHGVGSVRKYTIGAFLLDLNDPTKVIGRTKQPLIAADENEREGYVPNVVYSCGSVIYEGHLILPYAMSDNMTSFAIQNLDELLNELTS